MAKRIVTQSLARGSQSSRRDDRETVLSMFVMRVELVRIDVPFAFAAGVLMDVEEYGDWNRFFPEARSDFKVGSPSSMLVTMSGRKMRMTATVHAFVSRRLIAYAKLSGCTRLDFAREQYL